MDNKTRKWLTKPDSWSMATSLIVTLLVAGLATLVITSILVWVILGTWPWNPRPDEPGATVLDVIKVGLAVTAGVGGVVALVVGYRRQRLAERTDETAQVLRFVERFGAAAEQLGGNAPAVRLAGVYAMASLADEYPTERQQCVDVLCGYLRLPFDPETDQLADLVTEETENTPARTVSRRQTRVTQPHDREVRATIVTVIRAHLLDPAGPRSWSLLDFDFSDARIHGANFTDAHFAGVANFGGATFTGKTTNFVEATFTGKTTNFGGATFSSDDTDFGGVTFTGKATNFGGATFTSTHTDFLAGSFSGETINFGGATFSGETINFLGVTFSGETTSFFGATFTSDEIYFGDVAFSGISTDFRGVTFSGDNTDFRGVTFSGASTSFAGATFSGKSTSFVEATFAGKGATDFIGATWDGTTAVFAGAKGYDSTTVKGLDEPKLLNDATISKEREPF